MLFSLPTPRLDNANSKITAVQDYDVYDVPADCANARQWSPDTGKVSPPCRYFLARLFHRWKSPESHRDDRYAEVPDMHFSNTSLVKCPPNGLRKNWPSQTHTFRYIGIIYITFVFYWTYARASFTLRRIPMFFVLRFSKSTLGKGFHWKYLKCINFILTVLYHDPAFW